MSIPHPRSIISLVSIIVFIIGMIVHSYIDPYLPFGNTNSGYENGYTSGYGSGYDAGFTAAKELVKNSSVGRVYMLPDDARSISGVVTEITEDGLTFRIPVTDPFEDPALEERTVKVSSATVIVKLAQEEQGAFAPEPVAAGMLPIPSLVRTAATFSDIVVGDALFVSADENIGTEKEFTASEIQIQARAQ